MSYGYMGKIIFVDLSKGEINIECPDDSVYRSVLGGEGLGALILHERQRPGVDPLGPENTIGICAGLFSGGGVPGSSRTTIVTKSPLTGGFGDSNSGGIFAPKLKSCGYDGIFVRGISETPVYLVITEDNVELKDASHLWGKDTVETKKILKEELNDPKISAATIGPAGETLSLISSLILDDRAAARSGIGAVMGAKRLKTIVISGNKKVESVETQKLKEMNSAFSRFLRKVDYFVIDVMRRIGSCGLFTLGVKVGMAPVKNWTLAGLEHYPNADLLDGDSVLAYMTKRHGCHMCPICCGGTVKVDNGKYKCEARLPEYETIAAFGSLVCAENIEAVFKGQNICDRYGVDTISMGNVVAFAIECFENGIITEDDTDGLKLQWGDEEVIIELVERIVKRDGFGDLLADGVKKAAERIGKGSYAYAVNIGGQELPFHDFRYEIASRGTLYISDPTPARHERCSGGQLLLLKKALGPYPELQPDNVDNDDYEGIGKELARGQKYYDAFSALGMCAYTIGAASEFPVVDMISALTGWKGFSVSEFLDIGERIQILRQMFNYREGIKVEDFELHPRLKEPPLFEGHMKGSSINYDWKQLRSKYFAGFEWNPETGVPKTKRLKELGLEEILSGLGEKDYVIDGQYG